MDVIIKGPKGIKKRQLKKTLQDQLIRRQQSTQPSVEDAAMERKRGRPAPREPEWSLRAQRPQMLVKLTLRWCTRAPKAKASWKFGKEGSSGQLMVAKRPPLPAVRNLINLPSQGLVNPSEADSTVPAMSPVKQTNGMQWEVSHLGPNLSPTPQSSTYPLLLSPGDQFETELNQQLQFLIPDNNVRRLVSHVIRTLKMDCSESRVQLPCAKLISQTGLLMKLLSEQQEVNVAEAEWDTEQWRNNYIQESTEAQSEQKGQESDELTKEVPGYGYHKKPIVEISISVIFTILILIFCLIEIYAHRKKKKKQGTSRGFFGFLLRRKCSSRKQKEGFFRLRWPLWLRDMHRPLNTTREKNMSHNLHHRDSDDEEDEIFSRDSLPGRAGDSREALTERTVPEESAEVDEETEWPQGEEAVK
ncbi:leucine-rich repeat-containing protein 37A2-like [Carlito syrichta]|uniref:Leucine-rich repeat-containing protein 37A2-like n=1 Tax=Carlito syrichta TaxID=1868482 RepID=A0A3Q0DLQ4_CARSF|nr:leucine-rich repeat-containing protein 37A2-like [Carlito syrichta]